MDSHNEPVRVGACDDIFTLGLVSHVRAMVDLTFPDIDGLEA